MAEKLKEKEAPKERLLPAVSRAEEFHSPIDSLGRSASHIRLRSESARAGGATAIARADLDMRIARNVSELRLEAFPWGERFQQLVAEAPKTRS